MQKYEKCPLRDLQPYPQTKKEKLLRIVKNVTTLFAVMVICTIVSTLIRHFGAHESNFVMVYLL